MSSPETEKRRAAAKAELDELLAQGLVRPVLLLPAALGGTDDTRNVTWLPPASIREKEEFDAKVRQEVRRGLQIEYAARPAYEGDSLVPALLELTASGDGRSLRNTIEVILWRGDLNDDCTAIWSGLMLRAEQMDRLSWWWAVYDQSKDGQVRSSNDPVNGPLKSGRLAREAAEKAAREYCGTKRAGPGAPGNPSGIQVG